MTSVHRSTLWENRKFLLICSAVAISSMPYGIDTAAVEGLQAMPGFLMVFGYKDPTSPLEYGINVSVSNAHYSISLLTRGSVDVTTTHEKSHEFGSLHFCHRSRYLRRIVQSQASFVAGVPRMRRGCRVADWLDISCRSLRRSALPWLRE